MAFRTFQHWWGGQNPTKMGLKINWQNYNHMGISSSEYFREHIFSGTFFNYADAAPRHGVLPYFSDNHYDFPGGWSQHNWKEGMYIPCFKDAKTSSPHMPHITSRVLESYIDGGAYGAGVSNKLLQIGNQNNSWFTTEASNVTPQQVFDVVKALRQSLKTAKPANTPNLLWMGPNIYYQFVGLTGGDAWRNGPTWMEAFENLLFTDPACIPAVWGFCILADNATNYEIYFNEIADKMTEWGQYKFRIVDAWCTAPDLATQTATMTKALQVMDATPQCTGTYWRFAENQFGLANCPWPLANPTGYPASGHFPWPFAITGLGAHWIGQWNSRYDIYNPNNAPAVGVQPYPMNLPA